MNVRIEKDKVIAGDYEFDIDNDDEELIIRADRHSYIAKKVKVTYKGKDISHICNGIILDIRVLLNSLEDTEHETTNKKQWRS